MSILRYFLRLAKIRPRLKSAQRIHYFSPFSQTNFTGPLNESITHDDAHTKIYTDINGEGEFVRLRDQFYLLDPVDESVKGRSFCHQMTDFKLLTNGSLVISSTDIVLKYDEFCVKKEASEQI
jgi:hypothetical protein